MPFNTQVLIRRRKLLNMSQLDLAITAGVSQTSIQRLEQDRTPEGGGKTGIDVAMRLAEALQMDVRELLIPPTGNRYTRAVQFAAHQNSPVAVPHLHDRGRSVKAKGYRRMTGASAAKDMAELDIMLSDGGAQPDEERDEVTTFEWHPDPSTE